MFVNTVYPCFFRLEAKVRNNSFFLEAFPTMGKMDSMLGSVVFFCALVEFCYGAKMPQSKNNFDID